MSEAVKGRFHEPGSSRFGAATLSYARGVFHLCVEADGRSVTWGRAATEISDPVTGLPRRFVFPDGSAFEADPSPALDTFLNALGLETGPRWRFRRHPRLMAGVIAATIALPFLLWFGFPKAMDALALAVPESFAAKIGSGTFEGLDGRLFLPTQIAGTRRSEIEVLFNEVRSAAEVPEDRVRLLFRAAPRMGANGLAFPDGTIVVTDELVRLSRHDDEIAGVLAHEIAHVTERHALRRIFRATGVAFLIQFALGDTVSLLEEAATLGAFVLELGYSREFELEADSRAADILRAIDRDPARIVHLLRRIAVDCGGACEETSLLSTHPGFEDRLRAVEE